MNNFIQQFENEQMTRKLPDFAAGDTVVVNVKVKEGSRERIQAFEGVCIARRNRGLHSAFTVRKISHGTGVERVFQSHSALIDSVVVKRKGKVRSAKLYRLRGLEGKAARIKEDISARTRVASAAKQGKADKQAESAAKPEADKPEAPEAAAE